MAGTPFGPGHARAAERRGRPHPRGARRVTGPLAGRDVRSNPPNRIDPGRLCTAAARHFLPLSGQPPWCHSPTSLPRFCPNSLVPWQTGVGVLCRYARHSENPTILVVLAADPSSSEGAPLARVFNTRSRRCQAEIRKISKELSAPCHTACGCLATYRTGRGSKWCRAAVSPFSVISTGGPAGLPSVISSGGPSRGPEWRNPMNWSLSTFAWLRRSRAGCMRPTVGGRRS
jgi:hypothetical protein